MITKIGSFVSSPALLYELVRETNFVSIDVHREWRVVVQIEVVGWKDERLMARRRYKGPHMQQFHRKHRLSR